jgi:hypothetical protein
MTRTERLTERAITFAIAEPDEDLAVARLAFLAQGDHAALDEAIDACLARTERTLYTRWRAISFLVRVRYEDQPTPNQPATASAGRPNGNKPQAPGSSRGPSETPARLERFLYVKRPRRRGCTQGPVGEVGPLGDAGRLDPPLDPGPTGGG